MSTEGYMNLMKVTQDDAKFQEWLKTRIMYVMDRVSTFIVLINFYRVNDARVIYKVNYQLKQELVMQAK